MDKEDYIREQLPKLKEAGHDTNEIEELLELAPAPKIRPKPTDQLDYERLTAFFYEEPERMAHLVGRILEAKVPIETTKECLAEEGCWATEEDMALITAELFRSPPPTEF